MAGRSRGRTAFSWESLRGIDSLDVDHMAIQATAVQFSDGRIDDGNVHEPHVYVDDLALSSQQARGLAAALLAIADEADRVLSNSIGTDSRRSPSDLLTARRPLPWWRADSCQEMYG